MGLERRPEDQKEKVAEHVDFDDLLTHAGEFGLYQALLFISTMPFYLFGVFSYFSQLFLTEASNEYWCWIPELANLTAVERRDLAIPKDTESRFGYSQCSAFVANWTDVLKNGDLPGRVTESCQHGWEFNMTEIPYPTVISEWGWVCDKDSYQATAQAIFFAGSVLGGFVFGWLSDKMGRLPAIIISNIVGFFGGTGSAFARNFAEFSAARFVLGMAYDSCMMMSYLLVLEYIAPKYRTIVANTSFALFYTLSAVILPWIALACGHWKTLALVTSTPLVLAVFSPIVFLESPRWLLSKGRVDDAIHKLHKIADRNNKKVPDDLIDKFKLSTSKLENEEHKTILDVFQSPLLRTSLILICLTYVANVLACDVLVRTLGQLEFNFFLSFSIVSFTELPASFIVAFFMDWFGRRWLTSLFLIVASIFSILTGFIDGMPSVVCAVLARFAVNISLSAAMQWAAEVFPTSVRGSGVSMVHISSSIATVLCPYIVYLETIELWLPLLIVGLVTGTGGVLCLWLPETAKKDLPQTFHDAEVMIRNQKFWEMPFLDKKKDGKAEP